MSKWLCVVVLVAACGGDGPGGVSTTELSGFWLTENSTQDQRTVFAFIDREDTAAMLEPTEPMWPVNTDLAAVYHSTRAYSQMMLQQVSTYDVKDGALLQTVIGDVAALPGTMYSTKILGYDGETLTIESKADPTGMRTYRRTDRCASENDLGWRVAAYSAWVLDPNHHGPAIAIADDGTVYSLIGHNGDSGDVFPRFSELGAGCVPLMQVMPTFRLSAIALRDAEIHTALELQSTSPDDYKIVHRWKANRAADWQQEDIALPPTGQPPQSGSPLYSLHLFENAGDLVVVASRTNGVTEVYRKRGTDPWTRLTTGATPTRVESAAIGANGDIAMLTLTSVFRLRAGAIDEIRLPRHHLDNGINGGVVVDDAGTIHAVWSYENAGNGGFVLGTRVVYATYDGAWSETELGPMSYPQLLLPRDGKRRVIAGEIKNGNPPLALIEIAADGTQTSERISIDDPGGTSPPFYARMAVAEGKDGTIAASFNARFVWARHPAPARRRTIPFTVQITGQGRVYSSDGSVDCTQTCTTMQPEGIRLQMKLEAPAGKMGYQNDCRYPDAHSREGYCWQDVVPSGVPGSFESIAPFTFQ